MNWEEYIKRRLHILSRPTYMKILEICKNWTTEWNVARKTELSRGTVSMYLNSLIIPGLIEKKRAPYKSKAKYLFRTVEIPSTPNVCVSVAMLARTIESGISPEEALSRYNKTYKYTILKKARNYDLFDSFGQIKWFPETITINSEKKDEKYSIKPKIFKKTPEYDAFLAETNEDEYEELDFIKEDL